MHEKNGANYAQVYQPSLWCICTFKKKQEDEKEKTIQRIKLIHHFENGVKKTVGPVLL